MGAGFQCLPGKRDEGAWEETMKTVRAPFGKIQSRYLLSAEYKTQLPNGPAGKYVIIQYQSKFAHAPNMIETVTPMLDKDGKWKVSGYFFKAGQESKPAALVLIARLPPSDRAGAWVSWFLV